MIKARGSWAGPYEEAAGGSSGGATPNKLTSVKGIVVMELVCIFTVMEATGFRTCGKTA